LPAGAFTGPQSRRRHCVIGALSPRVHARRSAERAVAAVAPGHVLRLARRGSALLAQPALKCALAGLPRPSAQHPDAPAAL
jgi:hypothetical protein